MLLAVGDGSPALPVRRRHSRDAGTGRGLWLLDQYAVRHGVDPSGPGGGKTVWALLCPEAPDPAEGELALWLDELEGR